jgi:dTDP-4-dehydrorhamnose 3,5-epimerase-like enzyme
MKAELINLPKIPDTRGNLTFVEGQNHIPFDIKRVYWIYDVPGGEIRGGHAFKEQNEFIVAISGSFDVVVDDGETMERFHLNRSYMGLHVPPGKWRFMENFSTNSLALVLASTIFNENDYIRSYEEFLIYSIDNEEKSQTKGNEIDTENTEINACKSTVNDCKIIEFDINHRDKGNITVVENMKEIPFDINRIYYLYDVPSGEERGGHAHKALYQLIIAAGGSFDVVLFDGKNTRTVSLNRPYQGLYLVPGIWRELKNFSSNSVCLVLASQKYDECDYIRNYSDYKKIKKN